MHDEVFHFKQFDIHQGHAPMKVGTDSDLLGALCAGGRRILDIGTGTGVLALMLAQRFPEAAVTAIDIDAGAVADARRNFAESKWHGRLSVQQASLQEYLAAHPRAAFDCVVCNPPYFDRSLPCPDRSRALARHTVGLPFEVLVSAAATLLLPGGRFSVCLPPEVLEKFLALSRQAGLALSRRHNILTVPGKAAKRHIVVLRKGGTEQAVEETHCMRNSDRTRSEWYRRLMEDFLICGDL